MQNDAISVSLVDLISALSTTVDMMDPQVSQHHSIVAYIATRIARQIELPLNDIQNIFSAALIHDIGSITLNERLALVDNHTTNIHRHGELGARLLETFPLFNHFAEIVRFHHVPWDYGKGQQHNGKPVPLNSHIIHLADRIAVLIDLQQPILSQIEYIRDNINIGSDKIYHPEFLEAFNKISKREEFWLEIESHDLIKQTITYESIHNIYLDARSLEELAKFFAYIIDSRSHFTATHSGGVAAVADKICEFLEWPAHMRIKMRVAGYLHDFGKLAINNEILEKPGKLDKKDWQYIKSHSFYTRKVLEKIRGLEDITEWASNHHENLNGDGYPYRKERAELSQGSRILSIADIFTALTEQRPYRKPMSKEQVSIIINDMADSGKTDPNITKIVIDNIDILLSTCHTAQKHEDTALAAFWASYNSSVSGNIAKDS